MALDGLLLLGLLELLELLELLLLRHVGVSLLVDDEAEAGRPGRA